MVPLSIESWKKSVIHLECATDSVHFHDRMSQLEALRGRFEKGEITPEQFSEGISGGTRDIRFQGTGVFVRHDDRRFLVTARHVLWDETSAKRELQEEKARAQSWPEPGRDFLLTHSISRLTDRIFSIIFRVPTLDEALSGRLSQPTPFLMNLGAGTSGTAPYTFSDPTLDLAVISLEQRDQEFADELENQGYQTVSSDAFADGPSGEGVDVFAIGFPGAISVVGRQKLSPAETHWASSAVSLPTFTFGKVAMLHSGLDFFWCDLSVYPGNSGGPIIEGEQIVGIVSAQALIPIEGEGATKGHTRIPFASVIRAKHVLPLLQKQLEKDRSSRR